VSDLVLRVGVATQQETLEALFARSVPGGPRLPRAFVGAPGVGSDPGPLAAFVQQRRGVALDLYLLGQAAAHQGEHGLALPSSVWARALGISAGAGAAATISKSWSWLERQGLVATVRRGRLRQVRFLDFPPAAVAKHDACFELPRAYWYGSYAARLSLPGKAVLLIALSLSGSFALPRDRGGRRWGLSQDTLRRGSTTLIHLGLLDFSPEPQTAPLSTRGYTIERRYWLRPPFGSAGPVRPGGVAAGRRRQRAAAQSGASSS